MIRVLTFEGDKGARRYELAYQGFIAGGNSGQNGQPAPPADRAVIRQRARIIRAFKAADNTPFPRTVQMEQPEFTLLEQYIERCPWTVQVADDVDDLFDFLSGAEKSE